jgi:hypothetical protein
MTTILRAYRYLFFQIWCLSRRGDLGGSAYTAVCLLSVLLMINVVAVLLAIERLFGVGLALEGVPKGAFVFFPLGVLAVNYFLLAHGSRGSEIEKEFEGESPEERSRGNLIAWSYILVSWLLFLCPFFVPR